MVSNRKQEIDRLVSCFGAGDLAQAEQIARRLLAADRQDEEALHLLAQICYRRGRAEESVTLMKELLGLNPAHAPYNNDYGVMLASLGRWDEAATAYGVAVVLDQRNVDARFNLALALKPDSLHCGLLTIGRPAFVLHVHGIDGRLHPARRLVPMFVSDPSDDGLLDGLRPEGLARGFLGLALFEGRIG